jgi:hypothetical protein
MSSRSLAAARSRRAGENIPPVSGNRPGTSIGSFASHGAPPQQQNVRISRPPQQQNMYQQPPPQQQNAYQQQPPPPSQVNSNGLPFTKLSISDAIGLITIRLGRVEQWIIETDHENEENDHSSNLPNNSRIVDNSILTNFASRLDSLEKREPVSGSSSEEVTKLVEDVGKMNAHLEKIVEESSKHSLLTSKHTEQLFRFERELIETKDILKTFMLKYDQFANETNDKFGDFEYAISELEKNVQMNVEEILDNEDAANTNETNENEDSTPNDAVQSSPIMSVDLKSLIKQELATSIDE